MNLRRKSKATSEVSTSALNDIMFFLLLFFLIMSTMASPNVIKLLLPKANTGQSVDKIQISVGITKELQYSINKKVIPFDQFESSLADAIRNVSQPTIVLSVDRTIEVQKLVDLLEIGNRLKVKMILATEKRNK